MKLSASQLRRLRWCVRRIQYEVVERRTSTVVSAAAARGLATHEATAVNLNHYRAKNRYLRPAAIGDVVSRVWEEHAFLVDWRHEELPRGRAKDNAIAMSLAHARRIAQDIVPLDVEATVEAYVPVVGSVMTGRIDVISAPVLPATARGPEGERTDGSRSRQIRDVKTSDDSPGSVADDNDADQLATYHLICTALGDSQADLIVDYLWPKDDGKARSLPVLDLEERLPVLVDDYHELMRIYKTGLFPRTGRGSWMCSPAKCEHYGYCVLGRGRTDL